MCGPFLGREILLILLEARRDSGLGLGGRGFGACASGSVKLSRAHVPRGRIGTSLSLPAPHWRGKELDQLTLEGESPDLLHLEGYLCTDLHVQAQAQVTRQPPSGVRLHMWAWAGGMQIPTFLGQLPVAIPVHHRRTPSSPPQHTHTHTCSRARTC